MIYNDTLNNLTLASVDFVENNDKLLNRDKSTSQQYSVGNETDFGKLYSLISDTAKVSFKSVSSQTVNFALSPEAANFDLVGKLPKINTSVSKSLGNGTVKKVISVPALSSTLFRVSKGQKEGWKEVAMSKTDGTNLSVRVAQTILVEMRVLELLSKEATASKMTPKVYYNGMRGGEMTMVTKKISGGEAKKCLPFLSIKGRLNAVKNFGLGLKFLHMNKIFHNDIALRNMLIQLPAEYKNSDEALGCWLAKPIFDNEGNILVPSKVLITQQVLERIKKLNINQVSVFSEKEPVGLMNDFGQCEFQDDVVDPFVPIDYPLDCTSPERHAALKNLKEIHKFGQSEKFSCLSNEEQEQYTLLLTQAANQAHQMTSSKSDLFSFGKLLCDAILRPGLNTDLNSDNQTYVDNSTEQLKARAVQHNKNLEATSESDIQISSIDQQDYEELKKIDPKLAELAFGLLKYSPNDRPTLAEALEILDQITVNLPDQSTTENYLHKMFSEALQNEINSFKVATNSSVFGFGIQNPSMFGAFLPFSTNNAEQLQAPMGYDSEEG